MWLAGHRLALHAVGFLQHALDQVHAARHRLGGAAGVLDAERLQARALGQALLRHQALDLVGLAAQAHHQHGGEVGVPGVAAERAPQHQQFFAVAGGGAAGAVRERDHAVDIRIVGQRFRMDVATELVGDRARRGRRAVHAGQHADVVARGDAPVAAHDAHERGRRVDERGGVHAGADVVCALEVGEREVVRVHVLAGRDGLRREADDLVVAPHRRALGDRAHRDLVPGRDQARHRDAFALDARAAQAIGGARSPRRRPGGCG